MLTAAARWVGATQRGYVEHESVKLWATATNVQMPDTWQSRQVLRNIYGQRGDLSFPASGDSFAVDALNYTMLPSVLWSAAGTTPVAPYARRYYKTVLRPNTPVRSFDRINELLYWQAGASEAPLETLPLAVAFRPSGQVLMRDVWDYSRATLLEFKSTAFWNEAHHHLDQNAFTLFYKAPLLVDSGRYDAYASTHWQNYYTRTIAHNTMTVWDQAEAFVKYPGSNPAFPLLTNDGGQRVIAARDANGATRDSPYYPYLEDIRPSGSAALDGVALFDAQGDYMYVVGNASKAYSAAKLDQSAGFLRSIVFLPSPSFWPKPVTLVFDRVRATAAAAGLTKRFLLHTVNEPEPFGGTPLQAGVRQIAGDVLTIRNGAGMLFSQTLLPSNPRIIKVGDSTSQNFRFLVPAAGSVDYMSGLTNFPPLTDPNSGAAAADVGAWRVEISAPSASAQEYFLHVISVADNDGSVASPPTVVNHSNGDAAVAVFSNGMTVAFAKSNAEAPTIAWKCASAPSSLLVAGVQPNVHYDAYTEVSGDTSLPTRVVIAASTTGAYTSTAQGVLRIDATLPAR